MNSRKLVALLVALVVLVALGGVAWWYWHGRQHLSRDFRTTAVERGDLVVTVNATGTVEPEEVVEAWPDIPILGYTNHTDKSGLQRAHAAGFDQVIVKSALVERAPDLVAELTAAGATDPP